MLNVSINYPYPVIRPYSEDYIDTVFEGELTVTPENDGYYIHPKFSIANTEIQSMIDEGKLTYAIEIKCVSTWFRRLVRITNNVAQKIDPTMIHENVELTPCIIAMEKITDFSNADFVEEYRSIKYTINPGEIVGIGQKRTFDAFYQNDIIRNGSSIVHFEGSDSLKELSCDFTGNLINITLPTEQFEDYKNCGYNKKKYKMLNAILSIPVVVEAIGIISNDENNPDEKSGLEGKSWYKTIVANLKRYAENDDNKYKKLLGKPFTAAEILLGNNFIAALSYLNDLD